MSVLQLSRRIGISLAGLGGALLLTVACSTLPAAASSDASLALTAGSPASHQGVELSARVTAPTAAAPSGVTVNFYVRVEEFSGAPPLLIGSTTANSAGLATFTYQPTWAGTQNFVASAVGSSGSVLATSSLTVQAARTDPFAGAVQSLRPDGLIGRWVVLVLLALVIGVWITLLALVVRVQQGPSTTVQGP
ncbi:MAG: hypothetical protein HKL85_09585 [Acidimicrobiaceae bacterium]|nr:hypothetical protein [Acidimicrobiaceae bacterium]